MKNETLMNNQPPRMNGKMGKYDVERCRYYWKM